jgi:hypothetical protein
VKIYLARGTEGGSVEAVVKSRAPRVLVSYAQKSVKNDLKRFEEKKKDHAEGKDISRKKKK